MGPEDEIDPDITPPPHNLGAGAERAWRHADAIEQRLREKLDSISGELRGAIDELRKDLDDRLEGLDTRMARQEANMQELRGQDGKGGIVEGVKGAIADILTVRRTMTTQAISIVIIVLGAAFVLYSRLTAMETKLELLMRPPPTPIYLPAPAPMLPPVTAPHP